ncbi:unnamed protein product [Paramecium primaurelia]|uniref:Uncharacterized protein n=1 Tax=Paramecium primaurelia TaxID=5886 RepID=A0A8S1JZ61_PARPR|nr:unnamed protein product [Paramecium primaurelia]
MEIIKKLINEIQQSQSKGQELVIDHFLIGYLIGRGEINSIEDIKNLIQQLKEINEQMDEGKISSFSRDYFINQKLMLPGIFSQDSQLLVQQQKEEINDQIIQDDYQQNTHKYDDQQKKEQNKQQITQTLLQNQNLEQKDEIKDKNKEHLKQSIKQYNNYIQKVVQNSKHNQKQN